MKLYVLHIAPGEHDEDGADFDEWFSSLAKAKERRVELLAEGPDWKFSEDFAIDVVEIAKLPARDLVLACLNRREFVTARSTVVPAAKKPHRPEEED